MIGNHYIPPTSLFSVDVSTRLLTYKRCTAERLPVRHIVGTERSLSARAHSLPLINSRKTWRSPALTCAHEANNIKRPPSLFAPGQIHHQCSRQALLTSTASRYQSHVVLCGIGARHLFFLVTGIYRDSLAPDGEAQKTKIPATGSRQAFIGLKCDGSGLAGRSRLEGDWRLRCRIGHCLTER
jgi:hypothetical protein